MRRLRALVLAAVAILVAVPCAAQVYLGRAKPRAGSVEVSGGALLTAGTDLPDISATLTRNPGTGSGPFELFRSDSTLTSGFGGQARIGVYLSPSIAVEGGVQYARPKLEARLSADAESAATATASETVSSYVFTGSLLYHFGRPTATWRPFVAGGAGHVRDAHAGNELVETGLEYHAGAGIKSWFGKGRNKVGIRADLYASIRDGGVATEDGNRVVPTAAFSLAYLF